MSATTSTAPRTPPSAQHARWHGRLAPPLAAAELGTGLALSLAVRAIPVHAAVTDGPLLVLAATMLVGAALTMRLRQASPSPRAIGAARLAATTALFAGLAVLSLLALSAAGMRALFGPLAGGAHAVVGLLAALVAAYGVALPALKLAWLARAAEEREAP